MDTLESIGEVSEEHPGSFRGLSGDYPGIFWVVYGVGNVWGVFGDYLGICWGVHAEGIFLGVHGERIFLG